MRSTARPGEPADRANSLRIACSSGSDRSPAVQAAATALWKSAGSSGRKASLMHRERMVGITDAAPWLIRKKTVRGGGSSTALRSAFAEAIVRSFAEFDDHRTPAAGTCQAEECAKLPHGLDANRGRTFRVRAKHKKRRVCARRNLAHDGMGCCNSKRGCWMQRRGSLILTQQKARRPVGERRFADPPLAREQPGVMKRARVERAQEQILGRFVPEKRVPQPGMERVGRACLFGSAGLGRFALCHARSAQMGEA